MEKGAHCLFLGQHHAEVFRRYVRCESWLMVAIVSQVAAISWVFVCLSSQGRLIESLVDGFVPTATSPRTP